MEPPPLLGSPEAIFALSGVTSEARRFCVKPVSVLRVALRYLLALVDPRSFRLIDQIDRVRPYLGFAIGFHGRILQNLAGSGEPSD
jgi:hypothetical protein